MHLETYGRKADTKGRSTSFIFDEVERIPGSCEHVATPLSPVVVFGLSIPQVRSLHDVSAAEAVTQIKGGKSRKVRQDQHTILTVVASHPFRSAEIFGDDDKRIQVSEWQARTVDWLRNRWGDRLVSVIRHDDEEFPHLHAYVLPSDDELKARKLHPGVVAKQLATARSEADGLDVKAANRIGDAAYKQAMRELQDDYFQEVGVASGLTRIGPGRRRMDRAGWHAEQSQARAAALAIDVANRATADAAALHIQANDATVAAEARAAALDERGRIFVSKAREAAASAKVAAELAEERRRVAEAATADARRVAAKQVREARSYATIIVQAAEKRAAVLRRIGGILGEAWAGFGGVRRRLDALATRRVEEARVEARAGVEQARQEARAEVGDDLDAARTGRRVAEAQVSKSEARLVRAEERRVEAERRSRALESEVARERREREAAEGEREDFRARWAELDNVQIANGNKYRR